MVRHVRRTRFLFFRLLDDGATLALSVLVGTEVPLDDEQARALRAIPADRWIPCSKGGSADDLDYFAAHGLIVTDGEDEDLIELRRRDEQLMSPAWNRYSALFHAFTRWGGVRAVLAGEQPIPVTPDRWPPPSHFHALGSPDDRLDLPVVAPERPLYEILARRKSTRGYVPEAELSLDELAVVLRHVWGCHGTLTVKDELTILKKTSPSGGSQHPGEVYPLVRAVQGVRPGIYHYSVEHHGLEPLEHLQSEEVEDLIRQFSAGQEHFVHAQVVFLMTVRYPRNFWKYKAHAKAYRAVLLDAAHLSQTLFLVAAELGLGAFVSGAINELDIDRRLGLQPFTEGTVLMTGCGRPIPSQREPRYEPYLPARPGS